jgi:hypothetical protein
MTQGARFSLMHRTQDLLQILLPPDVIGEPLRWNIAAYERMYEVGILEDNRYELINGQIIPKVPKCGLHGITHSCLLFKLNSLYERLQALLAISLHIDDYNLPDTDFCILLKVFSFGTSDKYIRPHEVAIIGEVATDTLLFDLTAKQQLYARANVPAYAVLDAVGRRFLLHTEPGADGYGRIVEFSEHEAVTLPGANGTFVVGAVLPPAEAEPDTAG